MDMTLRTLSPVHIGSGNNIEPFDYVTRFRDGKGTFARINLDAFAERVFDFKPEAIGIFTEWISRTAERLARTPRQQQFRVRREFKLDRFARERLNASDLANALIDDETLYHYQQPINTDRDYEVREQIKTADNGLYIPGSSLKGALRTALAFQVLCEADERFKRELVDGILGTDRKGLRYHIKRRDQRGLGEEIDKAIFRCGRRRESYTQYSEIHFDLMRGLRVSDTFNTDAQLAVLMVNTFLRQVDRNNRRGTPRLRAQAPVLLEALLPQSSFSVRLNVDLDFVRHAQPGAKGEWIELDERFERLFGFSRTELQTMDNITASSRALERILSACRMFSATIAKEEVRWANQFEQNDARRILSFYNRLNALSNCVPVRLGWGSHFMSTTVVLALRNDPILGEVMTDIVRAFEVDLIWTMKGKAGNPRTRTVRLDTFPRSRRMAALGRSPGAPFGWVGLSDPGIEPGEPLVDVDELTRLYRSQQTHRSYQPRQSGRSQGPPQNRGRQSTMPRETGRRQRSTSPSWKPAPPKLEPQIKVREGQRVNAEVVSKDGMTVVVRLIDNQNEEVRFQQPAYPHRPGARVKVKVQRVDQNTGKVTRVIP